MEKKMETTIQGYILHDSGNSGHQLDATSSRSHKETCIVW